MCTRDERRRHSEQQRRRRMARRMCGHCGRTADDMIKWGRQSIAICITCRDKLGAVPQPDRHCALYEVSPQKLRPAASSEAESRHAPEEPEDGEAVSALGRLTRWVLGS